MFCRAQRVAFTCLLVMLPSLAAAQVTWQPAQPPLVTAENTTWFQTGEPITWNGDYYYPAGAVQGFNGYQMVRSGSFRGIPLYTDSTVEPYSIVFVPLAGGRMQPYERPRTGVLAGTTGSRAPSFPIEIGAEGTIPPPIQQAAAPPTYARAYDLAAAGEAEPIPAAASGSGAAPAPVATSGRTPAVVRGPVTSAVPPTGANAIWVNFDGRKWYAGGKAIDYDASRLNEIGTYQGWTVYALRDDPNPKTIYIPSAPGRLAAYSVR